MNTTNEYQMKKKNVIIWKVAVYCTCGIFLQGCLPYSIKSCDHHVVGKLQPCSKKIGPTPKCKHTCEQGYNVSYTKDKHYGEYYERILRALICRLFWGVVKLNASLQYILVKWIYVMCEQKSVDFCIQRKHWKNWLRERPVVKLTLTCDPDHSSKLRCI